MAKAVQTQLELKTKCEQVQQSIKGLYDWEQEIKQKEAQTRQQQQQEVEGSYNNIFGYVPQGNLAAPVRSCVDEMLKFVADQNAKEKTEMTSSNPPPASSITELKEAEKFNAIGNTFHKRAKDAAVEFSFHKENNDQNAIEMYSKAIEINDRDPTYFVNRANSLFTLERYEECITDCDSAIALDAECANAYYRRMQAYEYLGNNEQAYSDCAKILKVSMDRNQIARTKQDMERIEKRLKKEADIIKEQGNKHWTSKEFEKGRQCFSKAISLYGNDPIYFYNRSLCNFHLKDYEAVAKDCDRAIELDKDYFRPYYQRMRVRELRADYLGAINDCQTYLKLVKNEKQRLTAEKDLERLQLTLKKEQQPKAYNWNELRKNASLKPLKRITISEASSTADSKQNASNYVIASNYEAIPDAVIDKIFNNNTGERLVEPKPEPSNLESLFPSSSNKLKQYFSPPVTPSSPPKEMFRKADNKSQEAANVTSDRKEDGKTDDVVSHAKKGKDLINKGTCKMDAESSATAVQQPRTSGTENSFPPIPSNSVKFYHTWINLKTVEDKYQYLQTTLKAPLHKLLGESMSSDFLGDVFHILLHFCEHQKASPLAVLREVTQVSNVGLLVLMLSEKEKYDMLQLFDFMDANGDDVAEVRAVKSCLIY
ncbi:hypothetical protein quinque_002485 [Culex quinquefasciatus]